MIRHFFDASVSTNQKKDAKPVLSPSRRGGYGCTTRLDTPGCSIRPFASGSGPD